MPANLLDDLTADICNFVITFVDLRRIRSPHYPVLAIIITVPSLTDHVPPRRSLLAS